MYQEGNPYLFPSPKKSGAPLSRYQAYRMITAAAKALNLGEHISCHSLRKTFGYHAWKQGANQVMLMTIFNHSSFAITRRYLCIDQDEKDSIFRTIYQNAAWRRKFRFFRKWHIIPMYAQTSHGRNNSPGLFARVFLCLRKTVPKIPRKFFKKKTKVFKFVTDI